MRHGKGILLFFAALVALCSVICATVYASVTNETMMQSGFTQYASTKAFNVSASQYGDYAKAVCEYLKGQGDAVVVRDKDTGETKNAFSDKENAHMRDVRGIVRFLSLTRWIGISGAILMFAAMFFAYHKDKNAFMNAALIAFSRASLLLAAVIIALIAWGLANFSGLFYFFHQLVFTNDLWLLNPNTDLLIALMPLGFFTWYGGQLLRALAPVGLIILLFALMYGKIRKGIQ